MAIASRITKRAVCTGTAPVMFDRYAGDNTTQLTPEQKLYRNDAGQIVLPALNILSFLTAINTDSAVKLLHKPKEYQRIASAVLSSVTISPDPVPFTRRSSIIEFVAFNQEGVDKKSGVVITRHVSRLPKGIPNPKVRPLLGLPWQLEFTITISPHPDLSVDLIHALFRDGGERIGFGTFRKAFGKFSFKWEDVA